MSKSTITKLFVGSLLALVCGIGLLVVSAGLAAANGVFEMNGPDVVGIRSGPFGWTMIGLAVLATVVIIGAAIVQFVAWIVAVLNAARLPDKTWFVVLLVTGLLSFGLVGMVVYLVAAPDSEVPRQEQAPQAQEVAEPAGHGTSR